MPDLSHYKSIRCPKCGQDAFHPLGDQLHFYVPAGPSAEEIESHGAFYIKVCGNCAYSESYAQFLVDQFARAPEREFGTVSRAPSGHYLLTLWKDYQYNGVMAHDFTIPLSAEDWFNLRLIVEGGTDEQVLQLALPDGYRRAWVRRVGPISDDLASQIRTIVRAAGAEDV